MKKEIKLPKFKSENAERDYWSKLNLTKYFELADLEPVSFPNLKPTSQPISIRLPQHLLQRVRARANMLDIPYQSLIKIYLADRVRDDAVKHYKAV